MTAGDIPPGLELGTAERARPFVLTGNARARGLGQQAGEPETTPAVLNAVMGRIEANRDLIAGFSDFLTEQWQFTADQAPDQLAQLQGIAEGYGLATRDVFAYLHMAAMSDANDEAFAEEDGCSVVACSTDAHGPVLAKNRDYRGEHRALQRVFFESDPAWGERKVLSVGSLGSPGAFSSGMNSDGLALADTRIGWIRPASGWLRYFLMNEILIRTATVDEAVAFISSQPHVGGGSLTLMDATGKAAIVELSSDRGEVYVSAPAGVGHTNHFLDPEFRQSQTGAGGQGDAHSRGRLARIDRWLKETRATKPTINDVAELMAAHEMTDRSTRSPALCRHGKADGSETISTTMFACASRRLYFCPGNPCTDTWETYAF